MATLRRILGARIYLLRIFIIVVFFSPVLQASEVGSSGFNHVVREGQSLSTIVEHYTSGRLYGRKGAIRRTIEFNGMASGTLIRTGQVVKIPPEIYASGTCSQPSALPSKVRLPASQSAVVATEIDEADDQAQALGLKIGYEYFRLAAQDRNTGGNASFLSRMSPTLRAFWELAWNKDWSTSLSLKVRRESLSTAETAGKAVDGSSGTTLEAFARLTRRWSQSNFSYVEFGRSESPFLLSPTSNSVKVERAGAPVIALGHEQVVFRLKKVSAGLNARAALFFSGSGEGFQTELGGSGELGAFVEKEQNHLTIRGEAFTGRRYQNSNLIKQTIDSSGLGISFRWNFY